MRICTLLLLAILGDPDGTHQLAQQEATEEIIEVLMEMQSTPTEIGERLAARGDRSVGPLLAILAQGTLPSLTTGEPTPLLPPQREAIFQTFDQVSRYTMRRSLERAADQTPGFELRMVMLQILDRVGESDDLSLLVRCATSVEESDMDGLTQFSFEKALSSILQRDRKAFARLGLIWERFPEDLHRPTLRAIGTTADPRGLALISDHVVWEDDLTLHCLALVERLAPSYSAEEGRRLTRTVLGHLNPDRSDHCSAAVTALASLGDAEAVPHLIELLDAPSVAVRTRAYEGLKSMTRRDLPRGKRVWNEWYALEVEFFESEGFELMERLAGRDEIRAADAARRLAQHGLHLNDTARAIVGLLRRKNPKLRVMAARTLGELGTRVVLPELIQGLEDPDETVRESCLAALRRITGLAHPADPVSWQQAVPVP